MSHWKEHKPHCKGWQTQRDLAVATSGNPRAWTDLTRWLDIHEDSLVNAALAYLIALGEYSHLRALPCVELQYANDDQLPIGRRFRFITTGVRYFDTTQYRPSTLFGIMDAITPTERHPMRALWKGKHTAMYDLAIDFGPGDIVAFSRTFDFPRTYFASAVARNLPQAINTVLRERFSHGGGAEASRGHVLELSTCYCGAGTHETHEVSLLLDECRLALYQT